MEDFLKNGYKIINDIYSEKEINAIEQFLKNKNIEQKFGIREFLKTHPVLINLLFNKKLKNIIHQISPKAFIIKSIYFDKPPTANWIVNWHQDLTINVSKKMDLPNFKNWRTTSERTVVQPPLEILENIYTIRIHIDDCTKENGALRVIEGSHKKGVVPISHWLKHKNGTEKISEVKKGGILLMKPLILHSSKRTENNKNRRVIHIEFSNQQLPHGIFWSEKMEFNYLNG